MTVTVKPSELCGSVSAEPSKSCFHRELICAALSENDTVIDAKIESEDIRATADALESLGAVITRGEKTVVKPIKRIRENAVINCRDSASTFRFLLPVAAAFGGEYTFAGSKSLERRIDIRDFDCLTSNGVEIFGTTFPITVRGKINSDNFTVSVERTSQTATGLITALPIIGGGKVKINGESEYIKITLDVLREYGIEEVSENGVISVSGKYNAKGIIKPEGDWSNAAAFSALGIAVTGLNPNSSQCDRAVMELLEKAKTGKEIMCPGDIFQVLCAYCTSLGKETVVRSKAKLRAKESDRIKTTVGFINALGGSAEELEDGVCIKQVKPQGGEVESFGDHRAVMAETVIALANGVTVCIRNAEVVNKSFPMFFEKLKSVGARTEVSL